jgi:hypothetical protein
VCGSLAQYFSPRRDADPGVFVVLAVLGGSGLGAL